jgi:hypothetical protein
MEARVTLRPGQRGTKKLVQRYGEELRPNPALVLTVRLRLPAAKLIR